MPSSVYLQRARLGLRRFTEPTSVAIGDPCAQIFVEARAIARLQKDLRPEDCIGQAPLSHGRFCRKRALGVVIGGAWHEKTVPYRPSEGTLFRALYQRYHGLADWHDTAFFREVETLVRAGQTAWNKCATQLDLEERCRQADRLIASVKSQGFLATDQPIRVNIGPRGEFIKNSNGRHRIALGLIAEAKIPVQVLVRHSEWEAIRRRHAAGERHHPAHPDLP